MNSATVLAGTSGCTTITLVSSIVPATGALSRTKSKERRIDGIVRSSKTDGIAVGRRAQHRRHADVSAGADLVLDEDLLAQALRQILSNDACHGVVWSAGSERHDPMYWPRRISLRPCDAREGRQRG